MTGKLIRFSCLLCSFVLVSVFSIAEVSVDRDESGKVRSVAILELLSSGGGGLEPWPIVRLHIPPVWVLNPGGGEGPNPDGYPSLGLDPFGDVPEVTWARHDGDDYEIVVSRWMGDRWATPTVLTSNAIDDLDPEIAYAPDGTARLTYWNGSEVMMLTRAPGGTWSEPEPVDLGARPSVAGTNEDRVAYQKDAAGNFVDVVTARRSNGWVPSILATTNFAGFEANGDIDVRLGSLDSTTWVAWEDGPTSLGWSELLDNGNWSAPEYEPVSGPTDEEAARLRIRLKVTR